MNNWVAGLLLAVAGYWVYQEHLKKDAFAPSLAMGTTHAVVLDKRNFYDVLNAGQPVLVDFSAAWNGPCRMMAPTLERVANENHDRMVVGKVDVDLNQDLTLRYGVQSVPTLILFKNGREVERLVGYCTQDRIDRTLRDQL